MHDFKVQNIATEYEEITVSTLKMYLLKLAC